MSREKSLCSLLTTKTSPMLPCGMNWPKILKIVSIIKHNLILTTPLSSYTCQGKEKGDGFYLTDSKKKKKPMKTIEHTKKTQCTQIKVLKKQPCEPFVEEIQMNSVTRSNLMFCIIYKHLLQFILNTKCFKIQVNLMICCNVFLTEPGRKIRLYT